MHQRQVGDFLSEDSIGGVWSQVEQALHINILELRVAKFAILTFCRYKEDLRTIVQMDNHAPLAYLVKMGGSRNLLMIQEAKEIWEFCLANQITLTVEYLPETLNIRADKTSSNKWILNKPIFQKVIQALGPMYVDLLASRLCHQIPKYISRQSDPHAWMVDAFQINWSYLKAYAFPPFTLIWRVLAKAMRGKHTLIIVIPMCPLVFQPWYSY